MKWSAPLIVLSSLTAYAKVYDFEADLGGISDDGSLETAWHNGGLMNETLAMLGKGDTLVIPNKTYHLMGGIQVHASAYPCTYLRGTTPTLVTSPRLFEPFLSFAQQ